MLTWPAPHVPQIPGSGQALRLHDGLLGQPLTAGGPGRGGLLVCAPLPDGAPSLADAATAVVLDVLVRAWRDARLEVASLRCLHGVADDVDHALLAPTYLAFTELGLLPPDHLVAVTDPAPAACAAAVRDHLGSAVDVLAGARDQADHLARVAAALATATVERPADALDAQRVLARRIVTVDATWILDAAGVPLAPGGEGEGEDVVALLDRGVPPMAVRLMVLAGHYRGARPGIRSLSREARVADAVARLERWIAAVSGNGGPATEAMVAEIRAALADDLDTPRALRAVDAWADAALSYGQEGGLTDEDVVEGAPGIAARAVDALLGVRL